MGEATWPKKPRLGREPLAPGFLRMGPLYCACPLETPGFPSGVSVTAGASGQRTGLLGTSQTRARGLGGLVGPERGGMEGGMLLSLMLESPWGGGCRGQQEGSRAKGHWVGGLVAQDGCVCVCERKREHSGQIMAGEAGGGVVGGGEHTDLPLAPSVAVKPPSVCSPYAQA